MALNSRSAGHSMIQLAATKVGELITCILLTVPGKGGMGALVTLVVGSSGHTRCLRLYVGQAYWSKVPEQTRNIGPSVLQRSNITELAPLDMGKNNLLCL